MIVCIAWGLSALSRAGTKVGFVPAHFQAHLEGIVTFTKRAEDQRRREHALLVAARTVDLTARARAAIVPAARAADFQEKVLI